MSFFRSIKSAFGGSDNEEYDVFGQPTTFVNPFSKDKNVPNHDQEPADHAKVKLDQHEEYAIDAEYADKAVRLMNEHTQLVTEAIKRAWAKEREQLLADNEEAKKVVQDYKDKMLANEAGKKQVQARTQELNDKIAELEAERDSLNVDKKGLENRIRLMESQTEGLAELNKQVEEMTATIEQLRQQVDEKTAEIERRDRIAAELEEGPSVEALQQEIEQRDKNIENLNADVADLEGRLNAANEELKAAEELQKKFEEVQEFMEKKNAEVATLRQQVADMKQLESDFDEMRKANIVLTDENEGYKKTIEQLEQTARQNSDVQNRRSIETGNLIDGLKQQLATVSAMAEDYKRKYNSLSVDGNEKAANFAKISAERDDARAELKRIQVTMQKKQHEAQAMIDAIDDKDRQIAALKQQLDEMSKAAQAAPVAGPAAASAAPIDDAVQDDPALRAIDEIDWEDDGSMPPHPGEDPRQLSLF